MLWIEPAPCPCPVSLQCLGCLRGAGFTPPGGGYLGGGAGAQEPREKGGDSAPEEGKGRGRGDGFLWGEVRVQMKARGGLVLLLGDTRSPESVSTAWGGAAAAVTSDDNAACVCRARSLVPGCAGRFPVWASKLSSRSPGGASGLGQELVWGAGALASRGSSTEPTWAQPLRPASPVVLLSTSGGCVCFLR